MTPCSVAMDTSVLEDLAATLKMEAARSSEMLVSYGNTVWHDNPKDLVLNLHHCEDPISRYLVIIFQFIKLFLCIKIV
jgi:hypothetical protein